jgi:hypothetical protein
MYVYSSNSVPHNKQFSAQFQKYTNTFSCGFELGGGGRGVQNPDDINKDLTSITVLHWLILVNLKEFAQDVRPIYSTFFNVTTHTKTYQSDFIFLCGIKMSW